MRMINANETDFYLDLLSSCMRGLIAGRAAVGCSEGSIRGKQALLGTDYRHIPQTEKARARESHMEAPPRATGTKPCGRTFLPPVHIRKVQKPCDRMFFALRLARGTETVRANGFLSAGPK